MKSRTPILFFAIVFTLVCVYQLSFTWKVNSIHEEKIEYAETQLEINKKSECSEITEEYIINKLNGQPPPIMTRETEEELRRMFKEIQIPFEKFCPKKRKNFLSKWFRDKIMIDLIVYICYNILRINLIS